MRTNVEHVLARRESSLWQVLTEGNALVHLEQILVQPLLPHGVTMFYELGAVIRIQT